MKIKQPFIWLLFLILLVLSIPNTTYAHAYVVKSSPTEDEVLQKSPSRVSIQFDEEIQPVYKSIKVIDQSGKRVDKNNGHINKQNNTILEAGLKKKLPDGTYTIQWRVISSDGHPVNGTIPFQIGASSGHKPQVNAVTSGYSPHLDMIVIRWLFYISCSIYIGILFFSLFVYNERAFPLTVTSKRMLRYSIQGLFISIVLSLPLQTTIDAGLRWTNAIEFPMLMNTIKNTKFGPIWITQIALIIVLYVITYFIIHTKEKKQWAYLGMIAALAILASKTFLGHATTVQYESVGIIVDFLHMAAVSLWIGSMLAIIFLHRKGGNESVYWSTIQRFSYWGAGFVIVIVITGIYMSYQFIPTLYALYSTAYGQVVLIKALLLVIMIGLAVFNFLRGKRKNKKLGPSVWLEFITGVIVFVLAAFLTNLPTGLASPGDVQQSAITKSGYKIELHITPNVIGKNQFYVHISKNGKTVKNLDKITVTLTCQEMNMGDSTIEITKKNLLQNKPVTGVLSMAGRWKVHVHGLTKSLQNIDADFSIIVGSE